MSEAETRALRRAAGALLVLSLVRWGAAVSAGPSVGPGEDVLPGLIESSSAALQEAELRAAPLKPGERLDPNRASAVELDRLPGVGVATADAIVRAREEAGPFLLATDLERVQGIGPAMVRRLAPHLDLASPPRPRGLRRPSKSKSESESVDLNRASAEALIALPGIGPALAARIVAARRERPFTSAQDLLRVRGIGPATLERLLPLVRVGLGR